jgi:hypothetical protein
VGTGGFSATTKREKQMFRRLSLLIIGFASLGLLLVPANATPISGGDLPLSAPLKISGASVYHSSLNTPIQTGNHELHTASGSGYASIAPHQFALRVPTNPPPTVSETPEPSTFALFGTGLMMLGGVVRRKFRR